MPQDPAIIQRQIDETRAELAETIDAIADIVSPRRVAERASEQVRAKVAELRARASRDGDPLELAADKSPAQATPVTAAAAGPASGGRSVRWGRVALAVGATTMLVVGTTRRRRRRRG